MSFRKLKETDKIWRITECIRVSMTVAIWYILTSICTTGLFTNLAIPQKTFMVIGYLCCIYGSLCAIDKITIHIRKLMRNKRN